KRKTPHTYSSLSEKRHKPSAAAWLSTIPHDSAVAAESVKMTESESQISRLRRLSISQPDLAALPVPEPQRPRPHLRKILSWSPETGREEVWRRRKGNHHQESRRSRLHRSVTDEDLDELKACIELGFGFEPDSPDLDPRLSDALPALGFYCAVNKQYNEILSRTSSDASISSDGSASSAVVDPGWVGLGEDPETVKTRLRQWARVVACWVKQLAGSQQSNKTDH
ncbi:unnamed protein product, partial [Linum tenue]